MWLYIYRLLGSFAHGVNNHISDFLACYHNYFGVLRHFVFLCLRFIEHCICKLFLEYAVYLQNMFSPVSYIMQPLDDSTVLSEFSTDSDV